MGKLPYIVDVKQSNIPGKSDAITGNLTAGKLRQCFMSDGITLNFEP
jgi:hypothetical protein